MLPVREEIGPHRQILFLGGRSFEIKETVETSGGHRCLSIVERGQGLRREVRLVGFEVRWIGEKMRCASRNQGRQSFAGRLEGKRRSVAIWIRIEGDGSSSF
ncbi:hypothetical protein LOK49_LG01G04259 [Camellia lanceoleosa]|uniref:Uncharacterized protein n=1 Tax=Camellia lanceoleosa TaxID=1840588 RepID=A0ACC0IZ46_9ERIC|nr:hypothetical protein LOK49_LG01G04259 [Camellia lanceoleosa]